MNNQSINQILNQSATRPQETREATSQRNHTSSKPRNAKRRRLGGLRASRASVSLRDSLFVYKLFTEARKKLPRKTASDADRCIIFLRKKKETRARDLAYYDTLYHYRENWCVPYAQWRLLFLT